MCGASISLKKIDSSLHSIEENYSPIKTKMILLEGQLQKHLQTTKLETRKEPFFSMNYSMDFIIGLFIEQILDATILIAFILLTIMATTIIITGTMATIIVITKTMVTTIVITKTMVITIVIMGTMIIIAIIDSLIK